MLGLILSLASKFGPLLMGPISQFVTGINFGQVFSTVLGFLSAFAQSIIKYWKLYLIGLLIGLQVLTAYMWHHTADELKTEKASHTKDINDFKAAQIAANEKAQQEKQALEQASKERANAADKDYSSLLSKYNASLLRYSTTHQSVAVQSNPSEQYSTTEGGDGPSPDTLISITLSDAQICATNTARLQAVHDWAVKLPKDTD